MNQSFFRIALLLTAASVSTLGTAVGCSVVNEVDAIDPPAGEAPSCNTGQALCGGACIDVSTDVANCGNCGVACGDGVECIAGTCDLSCDTGLLPCGVACVDNATDPSHCGRCGNACEAAANQVATCTGGGCVIACADGFGDCNGDPSDGCEIDLTSASANCGTCGQACLGPDNQLGACTAGVCSTDGACLDGHDNCDGDAANGCETRVAGNQLHCGTCNNACNADQFCKKDTCSALAVFAADGARHETGNLYSIDINTGAVTVIAPLTRPYAGLAFLDGTLHGVTAATSTEGTDVNQIDVVTAEETFVASTGSYGPRGVGGLGAGLLLTCAENGHDFRTVDILGGEVTPIGSGCNHNATLFGDGEFGWYIDSSTLARVEQDGTLSNSVAHDVGATIRGATWHLGEIFALQCSVGCQPNGPDALVRIDPMTGTSTVVAALTQPNALHALASPRPKN